MASNRFPSVACLAIAIVALSLGIQSCDSSSDSPEKEEPIQSASIDEAQYTVEGDRMVFTHSGERIHTRKYCTYGLNKAGSTSWNLVVEYDTLKSNYEVRWSLDEDTLKLTYPDTNRSYNNDIPYQNQSLYLRVAGSGLGGRFRYIRERHIPLESVPEDASDASDTSFFNPQASGPSFLRFHETILELDSGTATRSTRRLGTWADFEIARWKENTIDDYAIDIRKIDSITVSGTGLVTHEVVTRKLVRLDSESFWYGDVLTSSSDSSHAPGIEYMNPQSCPNGIDWYVDFQFGNHKSLMGGRALADLPLPSNPPILGSAPGTTPLF